MVDFCVEDFMEMRYHKLEIILKDRKIGKSDRKIGSDFEKKKDRIGKSDRPFFLDRPITNYDTED